MHTPICGGKGKPACEHVSQHMSHISAQGRHLAVVREIHPLVQRHLQDGLLRPDLKHLLLACSDTQGDQDRSVRRLPCAVTAHDAPGAHPCA